MIALLVATLCVLLVILQDLVPGQKWYHGSAYAWGLILLTSALAWRTRAALRSSALRTTGVLIAAAGTAVVAIAGLESAVVGPDTQTVVRAPAERVAIAEPAGVITFPGLDDAGGAITFQPQGRATFRLGNRRFFGAYIFLSAAREVAVVTAATAGDPHLTITQPDNSSFLSPVLLFAARSEIAGRTLPVDSFAIPALRRSVKAVLFSMHDIMQMGTEVARDPRPGVLLAVNDEHGRLLPGAIRLVRSGERTMVDGVILSVRVTQFRSVEIAAAPYWPLLLLGLVLYLAGVVLVFRPLEIRSA